MIIIESSTDDENRLPREAKETPYDKLFCFLFTSDAGKREILFIEPGALLHIRLN